jgi:hypothetical protein
MAMRTLLVLLFLFWASYHMASIALPYLLPPFPTDIDFLSSKQEAWQHWDFVLAFYLHISSSIFVMAAGLTQFSPRFLSRYPLWHRRIGKLYLGLILFLAAPSGLVMAIYGNGGILGILAFIAQGSVWWYFSWMAYRRARQRQWWAHGAFVLRSYAMTLSAISLRLMVFLLALTREHHEWQYPESYILVAWSSWLFNLFVAEYLLRRGYLQSFFVRPIS